MYYLNPININHSFVKGPGAPSVWHTLCLTLGYRKPWQNPHKIGSTGKEIRADPDNVNTNIRRQMRSFMRAVILSPNKALPRCWVWTEGALWLSCRKWWWTLLIVRSPSGVLEVKVNTGRGSCVCSWVQEHSLRLLGKSTLKSCSTRLSLRNSCQVSE